MKCVLLLMLFLPVSSGHDQLRYLRIGNGTANGTAYTVPKTCGLQLLDGELKETVRNLNNKAGHHKLTRFHLSISGYNETDDPLAAILLSHSYQPYKWMRVYNQHGLTLLSLSFNYDVLSMRMLTYGVEEIQVQPLFFAKVLLCIKSDSLRKSGRH